MSVIANGIEIGDTDVLSDIFLEWMAEEAAHSEWFGPVAALAFDEAADKAFEEEVCWQERDDQHLMEWEAMHLRSRVCLAVRSDLSRFSPFAEASALWGEQEAGEEIEAFLTGLRLAREMGGSL